MTNRVSVAVVGATGVVGEPLLTALEARAFPIETLYCLDEGDAVGEKLRLLGKSITVEDIADFDFTKVDLVFFCGEVDVSVRHAPMAIDSDCKVIDCSGAFSSAFDVPLVIPAINPHALEEDSGNRLVATPSAVTVALLTVLKPLHEAVIIERADITVLEPVSVAGKPGIDELAAQTVALLNMKETRSRVFPQQIAFNLLPQDGQILENGYTIGEMNLVAEAQKILGKEGGFTVNPTTVLVPVFYGQGIAVNLACRSHLSAMEVRDLLAEVPNVTLQEESAPTPVTDATKAEKVFVGRVREDIANPHGLSLWITADNVRTCAALNAVQIAELLEKCYT